MTLKDLKPGMVVEYANGERRLVMPCSLISDKVYLMGYDAFNSLIEYNNDLTISATNTLNINKVYSIEEKYFPFDDIIRKPDRLNLIWERPKVKVIELTLQAVADKFNIPIEQLRIKDA